MIEKKISSDEYTAAILNDKVLPIIKSFLLMIFMILMQSINLRKQNFYSLS